ncbi:aminotransferase class V-fold PLP-dependent enzyme [Luteitalea sp.]|uniref:aminotransferase class V-fold PLP-dependent enzyme n=1 Tax=Luteitalea sp. TaxID=2004800 RepID=UPI0037C902AB
MTADEAFRDFLEAWPAYRETTALDDLRAREYARLDATGHVYLDYTGGGLHADSQVRAHAALLASDVFGNPHSANPASQASTRLVERARRVVLDWFDADPSTHTVIFTANASSAIKLVGEAYPFGPDAALLLTADNHNSVNGLREYACCRGAAVDYAPLSMPDLRIDRDALLARLDATPAGPRLFAYPAQSNFSGVEHPLAYVEEARSRGWHVLLDSAAYAPTNRLSLRQVPADFVSISFYKMFGYPTGVGCLLARLDALAALRRPWFAGGTVNFATVHARRHLLAPREAGFEDGTVDYLGIPAVQIGLEHLGAVGLPLIKQRVRCLAGYLLRELVALRHENGAPVCRIYGPVTTEARGGTITFNLYDPEGHLFDYRRVEELANEAGISLRTGCFCNPGAGETAEGITDEDVQAALESGAEMTLPRFMQFIQHRGGRSAGALRVSLGIASNFADVFRLMTFVRGLRDQPRLALGGVTFDIQSCRVIRDGA